MALRAAALHAMRRAWAPAAVATRAKASWVAPEETGFLTSVARKPYNFGPGPGVLPAAVMQRAQEEFLDFNGTGMGVLESTNIDQSGPSHPGEARVPVQQMMLDTEHKLRIVLDIPDNYRVLFMQGGAVGQFSAVPLNLAGDSTAGVDIAGIGYWSTRAADEARKYTTVHTPVVCDGSIPPTSEWAVRPEAAYVHICLNETVEGLEFTSDPEWAHAVPLVADATSTLLSRPLDVARYGLVYASGGKNLPAGMCTVIIRDDLLSRPTHPMCPQVLDYSKNGGALYPTSSVFESMPNTPPVFPCWMLGLVLDDIIDHGGLVAVQRRIEHRMAALYDFVDTSKGFYLNTVDPEFRSRMNAPIRIKGGDRDLERRFVAEAEQEGLYHLFGHPVRGGIRATTYIGLPDDGITALIEFMSTFMDKYRHH